MRVFDRALHRRRRDRAAADGGAEFLFEAVAERLAERLDDVRRDFARALDLGCRRGALTRRLAAREDVGTVVGSDLSPAMAAAAEGAALRVCADEELLPFADGTFDLVASGLSLHWVNDLPGALAQARRALAPDGLFLAALLGGDTLVELRRALIEAELETTGGASPRTSPMADVPDLGALLQRAGFALPVVDSETLTVTYPDALALMRDLRAMGETAALAARPDRALRRDTLFAAAERYRALYADAAGRVPATFQVLTLTGWAPHPSQQRPLRPGSAAARLADALGAREIPTGVPAGPAKRKD